MEREQQKLVKVAEKQIRKADRETKKQFSLGSCLQVMTKILMCH